MSKVSTKVIISLILLLAIGASLLLALHHSKTQKPSNSNSNTPVNNSAITKPSTPNSSSTDKTTTPTSSEVLNNPSGNFVSSHHVSLSQSKTSTLENSVCVTSPGASCAIEFVKGDTTKTLPYGVANSSGSVFWNWQPSDLGLSVGSWQITAITTKNGQTKMATDPLTLEISP